MHTRAVFRVLRFALIRHVPRELGEAKACLDRSTSTRGAGWCLGHRGKTLPRTHNSPLTSPDVVEVQVDLGGGIQP
jgi:hypothetical protein